MGESCIGCPSRLGANEAGTFFKKSIGAPMCGRYGFVLGKPELSAAGEKRIAEHYGADCDSVGASLPGGPAVYNTKVALPDPVVLKAGMTNDAQQKSVNSCLGCSNYIPAEKVMEKYGWPAGMCAATGRLLLTPRLSIEAQNCGWRQPGGAHEIEEMALVEPYDSAMAPQDAVSVFLRTKAHGGPVDPNACETDRPVSEDDSAAGVRAWRRIPDPSNDDRATWLPIYKGEMFEDEESDKIPHSGDEEHPELYVDHSGLVYRVAVLWRELDETPALWGMPGTGKTELARHMAWLMQLPFDRVSITASSEIDDLAGKMHFSPEKGTFFQYGRLPNRWGKPGVLVLDEPNTGPDEVWQFIRPLTDNSKQLVLDQNRGERLSRNDDCYLMLAMNPAWDIRNVGANQIGDADGNRLMHLHLELPPEKLEREIIRQRVEVDGKIISDKDLDRVMAIAKDIRGLTEDGSLPITWGIRPQIKVARAIPFFDLLTVYRLAVADYLEPEAREAILDAVRAHVA